MQVPQLILITILYGFNIPKKLLISIAITLLSIGIWLNLHSTFDFQNYDYKKYITRVKPNQSAEKEIFSATPQLVFLKK